MFDFNKFKNFSFKNEPAWMIIFGLLPLVLGIIAFLIIMILNEI